MSIEQRRTAGESIGDVLARIHAVDVDAVGLGDLGRKDGYIERQLKRWYGQWEQSKTRELAAVDEVHERLLQNVPEQQWSTIVHGDYRLDNCMLGDDGNVIAVLDWEICTLGDPLADVGLLLVYWGDPDAEATAIPGAPTTLEGFPRPDADPRDLRRRHRPRPVGHRLLRSVRVLEAGVHPRGCLRPVQGWRHGWLGRRRHLRLLRPPGRVAGRDGARSRGAAAMSLFELHEHPELESPVMIQALDGWIDAGLGASTAIEAVLGSTDATTVATFDVDVLLDHRARRPTMHLVDGVNTDLHLAEHRAEGRQRPDGQRPVAPRGRRARPPVACLRCSRSSTSPSSSGHG
ncbi:MAG: phosphotransferase [Acidimicrobiia bacterium]|nr:phosphotransferase [Acidimicrobiia bacterium]